MCTVGVSLGTGLGNTALDHRNELHTYKLEVIWEPVMVLPWENFIFKSVNECKTKCKFTPHSPPIL